MGKIEIVLNSCAPLMSGASYLFTGSFDFSQDLTSLHRRIRVVPMSGGKVAREGWVTECPLANQSWSFKLSERIPFGIPMLAVVSEVEAGDGSWEEVQSWEFPVREWPRERWRWIRKGIVRYHSLLWKPVRMKFSELRWRVFPRLMDGFTVAVWDRYCELSGDDSPKAAWYQLTAREKDRLWMQLQKGPHTTGIFYQYSPKAVCFETFPTASEKLPSTLKLTVVTPSFQQSRFLPKTMDSVLSQEGSIDYIVMDGGSEDGSIDVIREREDRLKYWQSAPDGGQSAAIRAGFEKMECGEEDIMCYLNSDDTFSPGVVSFVLQKFEENPELDVIYGHRIIIDGLGREVGRWVLPPHDPGILSLVDYVPQETLFWRRRLYDKVGGIDPFFQFAMDWDLLLRFMNAGATIERLPWFLSCFRVHGDQKTHLTMANVGLEEMRQLRIRENGGSAVPAERIIDAVRRTNAESAWYRDQLTLGRRI
jgi:hypothetical protein